MCIRDRKDIVIDGVKKYTPAQILRFTGLNKNEVIEIPGQKISNAIKKLWETQSFSEVEVYVQSVEGEHVILRFNLQDLKDLGEVKFTGKGIGKSKSEKMVKDNKLKPGTKVTQNLISTLKTNIPQEYIKKGFADAKITIQDKVNANDPNPVSYTHLDVYKRQMLNLVEITKNNKRGNLVLALSYGSKDEILNAVKKISGEVKVGTLEIEDINNKIFEEHLYTRDLPPVDLLIRTSGEVRISNFLLWQIAYAELQFLDIMWPDYGRETFFECIYCLLYTSRCV